MDVVELASVTANVVSLIYITYSLHVKMKREQRKAVIEALKLANGELEHILIRVLKSDQVEETIKEIVKYTIDESEVSKKIDLIIRKLCKHYDEFCNM